MTLADRTVVGCLQPSSVPFVSKIVKTPASAITSVVAVDDEEFNAFVHRIDFDDDVIDCCSKRDRKRHFSIEQKKIKNSS